MRRRRLLWLAPLALSSALACAGDPPPPPQAPAVTIPPPPPPAPLPPPAPPALLVIPRAEASPEAAPAAAAVEVAPLRSEGKHHALERTAYGIVVMSEERGVLGFLPPPASGAPIVWAGFVEEDAVLIATRDGLQRAATPDDAIAGILDPMEKIDPAATRMASAGKLVVAAVPGAGGAYYESRDGGHHFAAAPRPAPGPIVDLAVRSDGVVVAAIETGVFKRDGRAGVRAEARVSRRPGPWVRGPVIESFGTALTQSGDAIVVLSPGKSGDLVDLGLDAGGRWIPASYPATWPFSASLGSTIDVAVPVDRPGFPRRAKADDGSVGGLLAMLGSAGRGCAGVGCLADRPAVAGPPAVRAFQDARCAKEHVVSHSETMHLMGYKGSPGRDIVDVHRSCDPAAPAERPASLLVPLPTGPRVLQLPPSCAAGVVVGTERASFVHCSAKHDGRPELIGLTPNVKIVVHLPANVDVTFHGAESASDGTTVLFSNKGLWLCAVAPASRCELLPISGFLAARPLPGGRALVACHGNTDALRLELWGDTGLFPLQVRAGGNVLDLQITAEGHVRLWTSPSRQWMGSIAALASEKKPLQLDAVLVRADGATVPDVEAKERLLAAIDAARATAPRR